MNAVHVRPELLRSYKSQPLLDSRPHLEAEAAPLRLRDDGGDEAVGDGGPVAGEEGLLLEVARLEALELFRQVAHAALDELLVRRLARQSVLVEAARVRQVVARAPDTQTVNTCS